MQVLILAAGMGRRLGSMCDRTPKGLLRVGPRTLIEHQLAALRRMAIDSVCLVVGHMAWNLRRALRDRCEYIVNSRYEQTNSLYSLWLARRWVRGPLLLMNCDVLAHPHIIARIASAQGSALAYDSASGHDPEHMKVSLERGCVRAVSKTLAPERTHGENVGILKFDAPDAARLMDAADQIVSDGGHRAWAPAAVDRIAGRTPIRAIDVADLPWCEIDFPEDIRRARQRIWPAIRGPMGWMRWRDAHAAPGASRHVSIARLNGTPAATLAEDPA